MKKLFLYLCLGTILTNTNIAECYAQKKLTMKEAVLGLSTNLAPQNVKQFSWRPNSKQYSLLEGNDNASEIKLFDVTNINSKLTLVTLNDINSILKLKTPLKAMPRISWLSNNELFFQNGQKIYKGFMSENNVVAWNLWYELPDGATLLPFPKDNDGSIYFAKDNNIGYWKSGTLEWITNDEDKNIVNGQSVHRNEFGINGGFFPSPSNELIAYYAMDQRMVKDYPIVKWQTTPAQVEMIKYPMAGDSSHHVTLKVYHKTHKTTTTLATGLPADQYLTCVTWSPDSKHIYVGLLNRDQNHLKLNQYSALSGDFVKTIFEEKNEIYVEPQHPLYFLPNDPESFVWLSQRDGFMHLYLVNAKNNKIKQLTKGQWIVNELIGYSQNANAILFTATKESPLNKNLYSVHLKTGVITRLDQADGVHSIIPNDDISFYFDSYQSSEIPRKVTLHDHHGQVQRTLVESSNPLTDYALAPVRNVTLKANDGTPLYGKLILPTDFDANKKYPVIVYLYNGPHAQLIKNSFPASGNLWYDYMAQRGYIVFVMDGRGSSNRGLAFEQAIFKKLGSVEIQDQLVGVNYLKSLPYVDANKLGIHGWSYGGFMTTSFMLKQPDVFKVGVAGGPVMDWKMYEIMYTERYMDHPQNNAKGYEDANLLSKVKQLKGKLLLIHGSDDDVVVLQHSMNFIKKCVDEGVQVDYFTYPNHAHNVRGADRVHLMQKITDYFDLHLKDK